MRYARRFARVSLPSGRVFCAVVLFLWAGVATMAAETGLASWYGEDHRGRLMADGKPFDPDKLTAASWFYPLGTQVRVSLCSDATKSVEATITDRGPAPRLVRQGRIIDLSEAAFRKLAPLQKGLVAIHVERVEGAETQETEANAQKRGHGETG